MVYWAVSREDIHYNFYLCQNFVDTVGDLYFENNVTQCPQICPVIFIPVWERRGDPSLTKNKNRKQRRGLHDKSHTTLEEHTRKGHWSLLCKAWQGSQRPNIFFIISMRCFQMKKKKILSTRKYLKLYLWEIWLASPMVAYFYPFSASVTDHILLAHCWLKHILSRVLLLPRGTSGQHWQILSCWLLKKWLSVR